MFRPPKTHNMITQQRPIVICFYHLESLNIKIHRIATHTTSPLRQHNKSSSSMILAPQLNPLTQSLNLSQTVHHRSAYSQRPQCYCITSPPRQHTKPNSSSLVPQPNLCVTWLSNSSPQSVLIVKIP